MRFRTMLIAFVVLVLAIAAVAQKSQEYWTVKFLNPQSDSMNVLGGRGGGETETEYDPRAYPQHIRATATEEIISGKNPLKRSRFIFRLENPDPRDEKNPETSPAHRWITFNDIRLWYSEATRMPDNACNMNWTPGVTPKPFPECKIQFMNDGPHPKQHYEAVAFDIVFRNHLFISELGLGQTFTPTDVESLPAAGIAILPKADCDFPHYTGLGLNTCVPTVNNHTTITRIDSDTWRIEFSQPIRNLDYGYRIKTYTVGKKIYEGCSFYQSEEYFYTKPIKFSMLWKRHRR